MKRIALAATFCMALLTMACDHFHTSDNDSLDGMWQLTNVDTLATNGTADVRQCEIFWSVQARLLEMMKYAPKADGEWQTSVFFRFELSGDRLRLYDPVADERAFSDSIITDVSTIWYYGISHLDETLKVLQLNSSRMTLESERLRMYFRKY